MSQPTSERAFCRFLKFWRGVHNISQEKLAQRLDSSPRHISRLESGHSRPSEALVVEIARVLQLGQRDSNHLLIAAGYAPHEEPLDFHASSLRWLRKAMILTLRALDPYPTVLMDNSANILMVNRGWVAFFSGGIDRAVLEQVHNHYDFLFSRAGAGGIIANWEDTLSVILMAFQQRALFSDDSADYALLNKLASHPNIPSDWAQRAARLEPMASFRVQMELNGAPKKFLSVNHSVGALGPTAFASEPNLTINTLFPEDDTLDLAPLLSAELKHPLLFY